MLRYLNVFITSIISFTCLSQSNLIQKDTSNIQLLISKKKQYHQLTKGAHDGYRVKIFFDTNRSKMEKIRSDFQNKYPYIPIYDDYIQPNFILVIGNCRTKIEAHDLLKKIQADFPNAFIIKTKINPNF